MFMDKRAILVAVSITMLIVCALCLFIFFSGKPTDEPTPTPTSTATVTPTPTATLTNTPAPSQSSEPSPSPTPTPPNSNTIVYNYTIVQSYPHDSTAFTEGLLVESDGVILESTGAHSTQSTLRRVALSNGSILQQKNISTYFAEGIALVNDRIIQLTWNDHVILVYNQTSFELLNQYSLSTQGWGLTFNGTHLVLSDGTSDLYFLNPDTLQVVGQVGVHEGKVLVDNLNELEYINGDIYANIWQTNRIAIIDPLTGSIKAYIDLTGLFSSTNIEAVPNGIAYNSHTGQLFVTGKFWPNMYEITLIQK